MGRIQNPTCERIAIGVSATLAALLLAACSISRPPADASGEEIYGLLCVNCHGADLQGGLAPALGPSSNSADLPDGFLDISIMRGRGRMPSFSSVLGEDQLQALIRYLRERQAG